MYACTLFYLKIEILIEAFITLGNIISHSVKLETGGKGTMASEVDCSKDKGNSGNTLSCYCCLLLKHTKLTKGLSAENHMMIFMKSLIGESSS